SRNSTSEPEPDRGAELIEAIKAMTITMQLLIETTSQRDAAAAQRDVRIGNLADASAKSSSVVEKQTDAIGKLTESIASLALTDTNQSAQLAQQTMKLSELAGTVIKSNQLGEQTHQDINKAVVEVSENAKSLAQLKEHIENLEKTVREDVLPSL